MKSCYERWFNIWKEQSDVNLKTFAIIRCIECTNGCIQHAFRDSDPNSLPTEKTRECMKLSMGVMKNKKLPLPDGTIIHLHKDLHDLMDASRDLYVRGFKRNDDQALHEFYDLSISNIVAIGKERIDEAFKFVEDTFEDVFTKYWIDKGKDYIYYVGNFSNC